METSVIGIYKSSANAQSAMNELLKTGISQDDMQLTGGGQSQTSGGVTRSLKEETGVGDLYRILYDRDDTQNYAQTYDQAAGRGSAILTVHAPSEDVAHRAAEVMERFDPIDVEEYAWALASGTQDDIQEGRSQSPDAAMTSGPSAVGVRQAKGSEASGAKAKESESARKKGTKAGTTASLETEDGRIRDDVQKGRPLDLRKGVRMYQRSSGAPVQRTDDTRFRSHWQNTRRDSGGSYDEYDPAYRYGSELRGNERWRGKQWADMEPDVRKDWEAKNPKGMWEKFKETVRYGWENPSGRYEDEVRSMDDRMQPGMGVERGLGAGSTASRGETSRPSTSVSPGTGTSTTGPGGRAPMAGGMSTSGASFTSEDDRKKSMSTPRDTRDTSNTQSGASSAGKDDVQKGASQPVQAAEARGPSATASASGAPQAGGTASSGGRPEGPSSSQDSSIVSSGRQDDVQKGRSQTTQAAATAGPSGASSGQAGGSRTSGGQTAGASGQTASGAPSSVSGGGAHANIPDDAEYRSHWQHSYWTSGGSFDDYAPAYRYGADYADNDTNPNHQWSDVEARMRGDWEAYNRDPGSWDMNKEAIRYGWEKGKQRGKGSHSGHALR